MALIGEEFPTDFKLHSPLATNATHEEKLQAVVEEFCLSTLVYVNHTIVLYHGVIPNEHLLAVVERLWQPTPWNSLASNSGMTSEMVSKTFQAVSNAIARVGSTLTPISTHLA